MEKGGGGGGWYVAVEPPVLSYRGSGVEGIASAVQHSNCMRWSYTSASWIRDVFCVELNFITWETWVRCTGGRTSVQLQRRGAN